MFLVKLAGRWGKNGRQIMTKIKKNLKKTKTNKKHVFFCARPVKASSFKKIQTEWTISLAAWGWDFLCIFVLFFTAYKHSCL